MLKRIFDLINKAWKYLLRILEEPKMVPQVLGLIIVKGVHPGELLNLLRYQNFFKEAEIKTIIDIGANTGQFSSAIHSILSSARIYAFEPIPECFHKLEKKFSKNEKFKGFCVAIGENNGTIRFMKNEFAESSSILEMNDLHKKNFPWTEKTTEIEVPIKKLDEYLDELEISPGVLLKIDVQGYETKVLNGAKKILDYVDYIIVEASYQKLYQDQSTFEEVYNRLTSAGFIYRGNLDQLISPLDGTILQGDALFVRAPNGKKS